MVRSLVLLGVAALVLGACGDDGTGADAEKAGLRIVVTTDVLGGVVEDVATACGASVEVVMGRDSDPHSFQASAREAAAMREASLLVVNGGDLEEGLLDAVDAASDDGVPVFAALEHVDTIALGEHGHDHGHEHGDDEHEDDEHGDDEHGDDEHGDDEHEDDEHGDDEPRVGAVDPHFWQDPGRMATVVEQLGARLAALDDEDAACYEESAATVAGSLRALDDEVREALAPLPEERRKLVTNHEAFGYFADAYDLEVVGTVVPGGGTVAEPSAADLADLAATIEQEGVPAIFVENVAPDALARALADEVDVDVAVLELYSGARGEQGSGAETYEGMIRTNARLVAEGLGG